MRHFAQENDGFSDQLVWSTICYLDPERNCQNAGRPVLFPVVIFLTFWIIFLASMYSLIVRVSDTGLFPGISCSRGVHVSTDARRYEPA